MSPKERERGCKHISRKHIRLSHNIPVIGFVDISSGFA